MSISFDATNLKAPNLYLLAFSELINLQMSGDKLHDLCELFSVLYVAQYK